VRLVRKQVTSRHCCVDTKGTGPQAERSRPARSSIFLGVIIVPYPLAVYSQSVGLFSRTSAAWWRQTFRKCKTSDERVVQRMPPGVTTSSRLLAALQLLQQQQLLGFLAKLRRRPRCVQPKDWLHGHTQIIKARLIKRPVPRLTRSIHCMWRRLSHFAEAPERDVKQPLYLKCSYIVDTSVARSPQ